MNRVIVEIPRGEGRRRATKRAQHVDKVHEVQSNRRLPDRGVHRRDVRRPAALLRRRGDGSVARREDAQARRRRVLDFGQRARERCYVGRRAAALERVVAADAHPGARVGHAVRERVLRGASVQAPPAQGAPPVGTPRPLARAVRPLRGRRAGDASVRERVDASADIKQRVVRELGVGVSEQDYVRGFRVEQEQSDEALFVSTHSRRIQGN
mmetsp:Transcript_28960/g.89521  ORF Transcript_28960/g.89521 Transcript_28960/m.89521 type:complete len:211 (+) Transcript_28960:964-1596(+)